jgi:acetyl-CoA C-acetyltransferase
MDEVVVVGYARTPTGKLGGALAPVSAVELGGRAIAGALGRAGCPADAVDYVVMGHVLAAGAGQLTARQAAIAGGIGLEVPAERVDRVCLSGMTAIARARDLIRLGQADVVVAGGMESMSNAAHVLVGARTGLGHGGGRLVDTMLHDGLTCAIDGCSMGLATDRYQAGGSISREAQDTFAARSHARAQAATDAGEFDDEIVEVVVDGRTPILVTRDEGIRPDTTSTSLARLMPAFDESGTITAGNASQISDGAAALVLMSSAAAERLGCAPLATLRAWAAVAGPDPSLHLQPARAIRAASARAGLEPTDLDLYEINEAFASVVVASVADLGLDDARVNVRGGGIALGHPIGASGARIVVTLVSTLRARGGGTGVAALCGGGGQGDALVLEVAR